MQWRETEHRACRVRRRQRQVNARKSGKGMMSASKSDLERPGQDLVNLTMHVGLQCQYYEEIR